MQTLELKLKLDGVTHTIAVPDVVAISKETIDKDLAEHPAKFLWYAILAARAAAHRDEIKQSLSDARAQVDIKIRNDMANSNTKTTEDKIRNLVETDIAVLSLKNDYLSACEDADLAQAVKEAFYHRKDALVTLGANMRAELETELYLKRKN